jgi:hypothetical protein
VKGLLASIAAAVLLVLGAASPTRAELVANLSGVWLANGSPGARCSIEQNGASLTLRNQQGRSASGTIVGSMKVSTDWGSGGGHITGTFSANLRRIDWSNGSFWLRESGNFAPSYISVTGAATVAPVATPNPWRTIEWSSDTKRRASPLDLFQGFASVKRNGTWVTGCVSFENTSSVVAKDIRFEFLLKNRDGDVVYRVPFHRKGEFSPNVEIHGYGNLEEMLKRVGHHGNIDNCWGEQVDSEADIARLSQVRSYTYIVQSIEFADGSKWPSEPAATPTP